MNTGAAKACYRDASLTLIKHFTRLNKECNGRFSSNDAGLSAFLCERLAANPGCRMYRRRPGRGGIDESIDLWRDRGTEERIETGRDPYSTFGAWRSARPSAAEP